jgi:glycosyltransferase involved in cell wall biosynthesis
LANPRVLFCSGSLDGGGSERQLWQLACQLPSQSFDKQVYLLDRRGTYLDRLTEQIPVHAFSDLNFHSRLPGAIHRAQVGHLAGLLKQQQIDVVYDRTYHMTLVTSKACRQTGVKRVSVIVSPPSRDFKQARERFGWFKFRILQRAYRDPLAVTIANSQSVADDAIGFYRLNPAQIQIVPNPVDIEAVQIAAREVQLVPVLITRAEQVVRIVVVARMTEEKGHRLVLAALKFWEQARSSQSLPELQVDFLGDGPLLQPLKALSENYGVAHCVHFRGFQSNPYPWIATANFLCIPSQYEGLPNVALEAMALRVPVIATPCSDALYALIGPAQQRGTILSEASAQALVQGLMNSLQNTAVCQLQTQAAYEWIKQHHGLQPWIDKMAQILRDGPNR